MASRSANPESGTAGENPSPDFILVGLVIRTHGLRGEVRIETHSDVPDRFEPGGRLRLVVPGGRARDVRIASFRPVRGGGLVRFVGCDDRDQAQELRGARLEVSRSEVPRAPEGLYYHFDLVGCRCIDAASGELGEVTAVVEDGGGTLLEIKSGNAVLPIPFVEAFLENVDIARQEIRLRLPAGLIEICASKS